MRYNNVKFTAIATYSDGSMSNCRAFATEKAMSNWANKRIVRLALCHPKARVRKKNTSRIIKYFKRKIKEVE